MNEQFFKKSTDIKKWLKYKGVKNYSLVPDGKYGFVVNVEGDAYLYNKEGDKNALDYLPVKFGIVRGVFQCTHMNLKSLYGCPDRVELNFSCMHNKLDSLLGGPLSVGGDYDAAYNLLTSLNGAPKEAKHGFDCSNNLLENLIGAPNTVGESFHCSGNPIVNFEGVPSIVAEGFYCRRNESLQSLEHLPDYCRMICVYYQNKIYGDTYGDKEYLYELHEEHKKIAKDKKLLEQAVGTSRVEKNQMLSPKSIKI